MWNKFEPGLNNVQQPELPKDRRGVGVILTSSKSSVTGSVQAFTRGRWAGTGTRQMKEGRGITFWGSKTGALSLASRISTMATAVVVEPSPSMSVAWMVSVYSGTLWGEIEVEGTVTSV